MKKLLIIITAVLLIAAVLAYLFRVPAKGAAFARAALGLDETGTD